MPKARKNGEASVRDDEGRKFCPSCSRWLCTSLYNPVKASKDGLYVFCRECKNSKELFRKHGLTAAEIAAIVETQGGCASCHRQEPGGKGWTVDHDHDHCPPPRSCAECRRGIVCTNCNILLGHAHSDPEILLAAIAYLERYRCST